MNFSRRKLPKDAAEKMRICRVDSVQPFALMPAPVYAFMKMNEKFVAVKAPLDFFMPQELERLKSCELFYMPSFVDSIKRFRHNARVILGLLSWKPETIEPAKQGFAAAKYVSVLSPASYELADAVLHQIGPLWGPVGTIEPFFAAIFVNDLCETLPEELLTRVRDQDVGLFEEAVIVSSWAVFLALHLGYCDLIFLNSLRVLVFETIGSSVPLSSDYTLMDELFKASKSILGEDYKRSVRGDSFENGQERLEQKMASRFKQIQARFLRANEQAATIFGEEGFVDA